MVSRKNSKLVFFWVIISNKIAIHFHYINPISRNFQVTEQNFANK